MGDTPLFDPRRLRRHVLRMAHDGGGIHVGCALSLIEICSALFARVMRYDAADPRSPRRDLLVLSKGHGVMALYACFRELGWLSDDDLRTYLADGTRLRGVSEADVPGCEVSSGSLGHGLPIAAGMALGLKLRGEDRRVWCIVGDGEMNEGSMWESLLLAAHRRLDNLTVIVDANGWQALGRTDDVLGLEPLVAKFEAFGVSACECDGHDVEALVTALGGEESGGGRPRAVVARTVKGCGVTWMADDNRSHYSRLSPDDLAAALRELDR